MCVGVNNWQTILSLDVIVCLPVCQNAVMTLFEPWKYCLDSLEKWQWCCGLILFIKCEWNYIRKTLLQTRDCSFGFVVHMYVMHLHGYIWYRKRFSMNCLCKGLAFNCYVMRSLYKNHRRLHGKVTIPFIEWIQKYSYEL